MGNLILTMRSLVAFVLPPLVGVLILLVCLPFGRRRAVNLAIPVIARLGLGLAGIRIEVKGDRGLLYRRPAVYVVNHQSGTDPIIIASLLRRDVCGVAKKELRHHPLLGPLLILAGTVFVDRSKADGSQKLAPALTRLAEDQAITINIEGRRSRDGKLLPFRPGALWLAHTARVPLIPLVLHNSREILPPGTMLMRPGTVTVSILPALSAEKLTLGQLEHHFHDALDPAADQPDARHSRPAGHGKP